MPAALLRACSWPGGCANQVKAGRCHEHARQADKARGVKGAPKENWRWNSWRWRRFSERFRGKYPLCGGRPAGLPATGNSRCQRNGIATQAKDVDHITPVDGPDDPRCFDLTNLEALCHPCHSAKTRREHG